MSVQNVGEIHPNGPAGPKLLRQITCPHCWAHFSPEEVLWISEHVDLLGDPILGPEQQQRFLPSRYTVEGDAIDARSMTCRELACPRCHLAIPRAMLELEPLFLSILGAPATARLTPKRSRRTGIACSSRAMPTTSAMATPRPTATCTCARSRRATRRG